MADVMDGWMVLDGSLRSEARTEAKSLDEKEGQVGRTADLKHLKEPEPEPELPEPEPEVQWVRCKSPPLRQKRALRLRERLNQLLGPVVLLPDADDTKRKRRWIVDRAIGVISNLSLGPGPERLWIVEKLMEFFQLTHLSKESKKDLMVRVMDVAAPLYLDAGDLNEFQGWNKRTSMAHMDFLYSFRPSMFEASKLRRLWWEAKSSKGKKVG